ncbi:MAG: ROK family protein [Candidatus Omnitrophica bacterium]|nr:ROK family protein [Candidatus Omnitrophota bacterium]
MFLNKKFNAGIKVVSVVIIQSFLISNTAWAGANNLLASSEQKDCLSPIVNIQGQNFPGFFKRMLDSMLPQDVSKIPGMIVLKTPVVRGLDDYREVLVKRADENPVPWGTQKIIPVDAKGEELSQYIKTLPDGTQVLAIPFWEEMFGKYDADKNPLGRNFDVSIGEIFQKSHLFLAGTRGETNFNTPHDTRKMRNTYEHFLTALALGMMIKIKYQKSSDESLNVLIGHEVRVHSKIFESVMSQVFAGMGITTHVLPDSVPVAIWDISTLAKILKCPLSIVGTASHSPTGDCGTKFINMQGSQFSVNEIMTMTSIMKNIHEWIKQQVKEAKSKGQENFYINIPLKSDPRITEELFAKTGNGIKVYEKYQRQVAADDFTLNLVKQLVARVGKGRVHIDCMHGSAYRTFTNFLKELGLEELIEHIDWMHTEERDDFGGIGLSLEHPVTGKEGFYDLGADVTQLMEREVILPDGTKKLVSYFPVLCTADYIRRFSAMPVGDIILPTDMDNDRLSFLQILPNNQETKDFLDSIGVFYNIVSAEKIVAQFIPNKGFHFIIDMNFKRLTSLMQKGEVDKNRKIVMLKTFASSPALDEYVEKKKEEGYRIEVINTAVGFAKLANCMYKIEDAKRKKPGEDIIIDDGAGNKINVGANPIILAAWEESGGIITGVTYSFEDVSGDEFLAAREKSATESIFLTLALISKLQEEQGGSFVNLAQHLNGLYQTDKINTIYDIRFDNKLTTADGDARKYRVFGAYLSLYFGLKNNKIKIEEIRKILKDMFDQEYLQRNEKNEKLPEEMMRRFKDIDFTHLQDLWFTGDGVMFVFENKSSSEKWQILFRPSGTEPKTKAYGFGKNMEILKNYTSPLAFNVNVAGYLPESFTKNKYLMQLWSKVEEMQGRQTVPGESMVLKSNRMLAAWFDFGEVVDADELQKNEPKLFEKLQQKKLILEETIPSNHIQVINDWLIEQGIISPEDSLTIHPDINSENPPVMQGVVNQLLEVLPESVYTELGTAKQEFLSRNDFSKNLPELYLGKTAEYVKKLQEEKFETRFRALFGLSYEQSLAKDAYMTKVAFDVDDKKEPNRTGWSVEMLKWLLETSEGQAAIEQMIKDGKFIRDNFKYVIFAGMGGSSLSVDFVDGTFGEKGKNNLYALSSTDPEAILNALKDITAKEGGDEKTALSKTLIIPISKSGTTGETVSHKNYFQELYAAQGLDIKNNMWVITDKGSPFDTGDYEQREIQLNARGDIGGRYTAPATNVFLMPLAILAPERIMAILKLAKDMNDKQNANEDIYMQLAAFLYHMAADLGKDKITFIMPKGLKDLPMWAEQLIEESLGKNGKGITIFYEEELSADVLNSAENNDRVFVRFNLGDTKAQDALWSILQANNYPVFEINVPDLNYIGGVMLGLERTVLAIAYLWDICAVNQPAVQGYKVASKKRYDGAKQAGKDVSVPDEWEFSEFNGLKLYYSTLINSGIITKNEISAELKKIGRDFKDAAAVYAVVLNLLEKKTGFEAAELIAYSESQDVQKVFKQARTEIFTKGKIAAKVGKGPAKNHSYHQNIRDGKKMWFSTYFMPNIFAQPDTLKFDENQIKAQAIGTTEDLANAGRSVVLITSDSTADEAATDLWAFFKDAAEYLDSLRDVDAKIEAEKAEYRYASISMGGDKVAISVNDGNNNIIDHVEIRWKSIYGEKGVLSAKPDKIMELIAATIDKLLEKDGVDKARVNKVSANLPGSINKEEGIFGYDMPVQNLPFGFRYKFREVLQAKLAQYGIRAGIEMCNDAEGSVNGEAYSPKGLLKDTDNGGITIIGGGINSTVRKDGKVYFGEKGEIKEVGHNLINVIGADGEFHYKWVGKQTLGSHPIEMGVSDEHIIKKSGEVGRLYVEDQAKFENKYPGYPVINLDKGEKDYEDRLSGSSITRRLQEASLEGYTVENLTQKAAEGDETAIAWIKEIGKEVGQAHAAFFSAYKDELFIYNWVLISGVNEKLGKGVYESAQPEDIYISSVKEGLVNELVSYFGMDIEKAKKIADGIKRSNMTYERELVSYQPTDEDTQPNAVLALRYVKFLAARLKNNSRVLKHLGLRDDLGRLKSFIDLIQGLQKKDSKLGGAILRIIDDKLKIDDRLTVEFNQQMPQSLPAFEGNLLSQTMEAEQIVMQAI